MSVALKSGHDARPGSDRSQLLLLPEAMDNYIYRRQSCSLYRRLRGHARLEGGRISRVEAKATGRPGYAPGDLLKIYIYGYINRIGSSRRLERETHRNIELMWLTGRLTPDFKTIADFRRDNGPAIRAACAQFLVLCRQFNLFTRAVVAIDGRSSRQSTTATRTSQWPRSPSASSRWRPASRATWRRWIVPTARTAMSPRPKTVRLKEKIEGLRRQMQSLKEMDSRWRPRPTNRSP